MEPWVRSASAGRYQPSWDLFISSCISAWSCSFQHFCLRPSCSSFGGDFFQNLRPSLKLTMNQQPLQKIRFVTWLFIIGLVVSGATAIPLETEVHILAKALGVTDASTSSPSSGMGQWLSRVQVALHQTKADFPFLFYGTDWLAFGHFMIALVFVGALRDPVRNRWLFSFGMIACVLVVPYALVFGAIRGIPFWWRLIDSAFGIVGFIPMWVCNRWVKELEA